MDRAEALQLMSALAQSNRLSALLLLVDALPEGMASSDIAAAIRTTPNTVSAHLAVLERAGLVASEKLGRSVVYRAQTVPVLHLSAFLAGAVRKDGIAQ